MKVVILAAGRGTRLRPLTDKVPKCLLKVGNKTVLERQLKIFESLFDDILIVLGYKKEMILKKFDLKHVLNEDYQTTNSIHSLWLAKDFLDEDTLIINGDVLFDADLIKKLVTSSDDILVGLTTDWSDERGYKVKVSDDRILDMGMDVKPVYGEYAGFIKIKKDKLNIFKHKLERLHKENKNLWFEDVFSQMARDGEKIGFFDVQNHKWYEFDTVEEYNLANVNWSEKMKEDLLMIAGPTEIEEDILAKGSDKMVYFRSQEFSDMIKNVNNNLKYLFQTKNPVYTVTSSGTGGMEFSIVNILNSKDKVLVVNGGVFGERWKKINDVYNIDVVEIAVPEGQSIKIEEIKSQLEKDNFSAVFVTVNETSTGALTFIKEIGDYMKERDELLYVDAISSLGVEDLKMDEWGCDVVVAGSQKGLALPPGLSFVSFSEKAMKKSLSSDLPKYYFDLSEYKRFYDEGQFPYTPNIPLLFQLDERLKKIKKEGLETHIKRYAYLTKLLRTGIKALDLKLIGPKLANCLTVFFTPKGISALEICKIMKEKYSIIILPTFGRDKENILRIGNYGNLKPSDILSFVSALEKVLNGLGYDVKEGLAKNKIDEVIKNEGSNFSGW